MQHLKRSGTESKAAELEVVERAAAGIARRSPVQPRMAVVLGSGLGGLCEHVEDAVTLRFEEVPGLVPPSVAGHGSRIVLGRLGGCDAVIFEGRVHLYEGRTPADVVRPVRVAARLGVQEVILTNASGGLDPKLRPPVLLILRDHLNLTGSDPLIPPFSWHGEPRFLDLSSVYSGRLRALAAKAAVRARIRVVQGVYAALTGPCYETPAEAQMLRRLGASAVGMSTVLEAIAARDAGLEVLGISAVVNAAASVGLSHDEVQEGAQRIVKDMTRLILAIARQMRTK